MFDFDGVLADSGTAALPCLSDGAFEVGHHLHAGRYYSNYLGYDDEGVFAQLLERHGLRVDSEGIQALIEEKTGVFDATMEENIRRGGIRTPAQLPASS